MPPRRGTPWASRGALISDRIRPSGPSQQAKSERGKGRGKGKGRANVVTPEPPRSVAVRRYDELIEGLLSSKPTPAASRPQSIAKKESATEDRDACFCQGKRSFLFSCVLFLSQGPHYDPSSSPSSSSSLILYLFTFYTDTISPHSPRARVIGIYTHLHQLRSHPLRAPPSTHPLPALRRAAPNAARA